MATQKGSVYIYDHLYLVGPATARTKVQCPKTKNQSICSPAKTEAVVVVAFVGEAVITKRDTAE